MRIDWEQYFDNNSPWANNDKQQSNQLVIVFQIFYVIWWFGYLHENKNKNHNKYNKV